MSIISNTLRSKSSDHRSKLYLILKRYLLYPTEAGLYGLYFCFAILVLMKLAAFGLGFIETLQISFADAALSLIGFSIMFLVDIFKK